MNGKRSRRPSPTFVVAMVALFVGLGGTAGAVATQAVPLAKRALQADNAKKLGGQTSAQLVTQASARAVAQASQAPGPASTAQGIVNVKTQANAGQVHDDNMVRPFRISCDSGQRIISAGFNSDSIVVAFESYPLDQSSWELWLGHFSTNPAPANVTLYAVCVK